MSETIYISGAITGVENYMNKFNTVEEVLTELGYNVINPAKVMDNLPKNTKYNTYMDVSIAMLKNCDSIYMLQGWENSKGAKHELSYAETYNLKILYEGG